MALAWLCAPGALAAQERSLQVRIAWGGGAERQWHGSIALTEGRLADPRPLGVEADEPGSMWEADGRIHVASRTPRSYDGLDVTVAAPLSARLVVALSAADSAQISAAAGENATSPAVAPIEIPLTELVSSLHSGPLDDRENRLLVRRTPGDALRVRLPPERTSLIFSPGEMLRLDLQPHLLGVASGTRVRFEMQLVAARGGEPRWSEEREMAFDDGGVHLLPLEIKLPEAEGVYELAVAARTRSRLRLLQTVAERKLQLVVVDPAALAVPLDDRQAWTKIAEIDPSQPVNPAWWNRFPSIPLLPAARKGPLGTGEAHMWEHPRLRQPMIELGGGQAGVAWEAYPLPIERPGEPHILEVEYPSDIPQWLGISVVEPNASGSVLPIGLDSGVYLPAEAAGGAARIDSHRLIFWPRTRSPLVLLTNRSTAGKAVFGRIRVWHGPSRLPRAYPRDEPGERLLAAYFDRPLFPENFSANESLDPWSARSLDDWTTYYEGTARLVDYLSHAGYNGLMMSVLADGSTIYPSARLQPTPRYDSGAFFGSGPDPVRKDGLELLLRLCDREGIEMVPALHFSAPLPELEALRRQVNSAGLEWVGADGMAWTERNRPRRGLAPYYNLLDPRVQDAMLAVIGELIDRYAHHPSLAGLAIELSPDGYAQLPGAEWGFDDQTVAAFERDHPGVRVPGAGAERFAARAQYLLGPERATWVSWRASRLEAFYKKVEQRIAEARPEARLYLAGSNMFRRPELERELHPALPRRSQLERLMLELGVRGDLDRRLTRTVLLRPQRIAPLTSLAARAADLEINQAAELDRLLRGARRTAGLFYHPPQEVRLESFDQRGPFKKSYTHLVAQPVPSGELNRRRFAHALATLDVQEMFDGGWLLPLGQEAALANLAAVYRRLPEGKFETVGDETQPVTLRRLSRDGRTYVYLVNNSPWEATASFRAALPPGATAASLDPSAGPPQLERDAEGAVCRVKLAAYGLYGLWFAAPGVSLSEARVELPPSVMEELNARMSDLGARSAALSNPPPMQAGPPNPGFEAPGGPGAIPAWTASARPGTQVELDGSQPNSGAYSVRMTSSGPEAWLRSDPFPAPQTGRLAVSVRLKTSDPARQPALRVAIEGALDGQIYYRYASVGQTPAGQREAPLKPHWDWYVFLFGDLPLEGLGELRVRFDLTGAGEVWIDDVQLFDLVFDSATERTELTRLIYEHRRKLQAGRVEECLHFLDSYWPRFLTTHVPLPKSPAATAAGSGGTSGPVAGPPRPDSAALPQPGSAPPASARPTGATRQEPAREAKSPGFLDRVRGWIPESLRF